MNLKFMNFEKLKSMGMRKFIIVLGSLIFGSSPISAETWLSCKTLNNSLFSGADHALPYLEIDGRRGILRSGRDVTDMECDRDRRVDPGLVSCVRIREVRTILLIETITIATDQVTPVAITTSALVGDGKLISPPTASRIALNCQVNAYPGILGSRLKSVPKNKSLVIDAK